MNAIAEQMSHRAVAANGKHGERNDEPGRGDELADQGKASWREHGLYVDQRGPVARSQRILSHPPDRRRSPHLSMDHRVKRGGDDGGAREDEVAALLSYI